MVKEKRSEIGFWVGGGVTPNKFEEFNEKPENPYAARSARNHVYKQLITCPFCGKPLKEENFNIDSDRKSIEIFCSDKDCQFYRYKNDRIPIPVYLVDEEIYAKCPTIILSTVDKFARLPWDVNTNLSYHGQQGNIELGTLIESKRIAKQIDDMFTKLIFSKVFSEV